MKKTTFYQSSIFNVFRILVVMLISTNIQAQNNNEIKKNEPDVHINVNRELDKDGNVTQYDSTYSWSWSSDGSQILNDSLTSQFPEFINNKSFFDDSFFHSFNFDNDSTQSNMFNKQGFDNFEKQMYEMMQRQQQIINEMFGQPPINSAPNKNNNQNVAPEKKTLENGVDM